MVGIASAHISVLYSNSRSSLDVGVKCEEDGIEMISYNQMEGALS